MRSACAPVSIFIIMNKLLKKISIIFGCLGLCGLLSLSCILSIDRKAEQTNAVVDSGSDLIFTKYYFIDSFQAYFNNYTSTGVSGIRVQMYENSSTQDGVFLNFTSFVIYDDYDLYYSDNTLSIFFADDYYNESYQGFNFEYSSDFSLDFTDFLSFDGTVNDEIYISPSGINLSVNYYGYFEDNGYSSGVYTFLYSSSDSNNLYLDYTVPIDDSTVLDYSWRVLAYDMGYVDEYSFDYSSNNYIYSYFYSFNGELLEPFTFETVLSDFTSGYDSYNDLLDSYNSILEYDGEYIARIEELESQNELLESQIESITDDLDQAELDRDTYYQWYLDEKAYADNLKAYYDDLYEPLTSRIDYLENELTNAQVIHNTYNLISSAFGGLIPLLDFELAPGLSLGAILTIPFVVAILSFILRAIG